jgi:hypothetical protein
MSAERMIVNAMQEQPILLLPVFMLVYYVTHFFKQMYTSFPGKTWASRLS